MTSSFRANAHQKAFKSGGPSAVPADLHMPNSWWQCSSPTVTVCPHWHGPSLDNRLGCRLLPANVVVWRARLCVAFAATLCVEGPLLLFGAIALLPVHKTCFCRLGHGITKLTNRSASALQESVLLLCTIVSGQIVVTTTLNINTDVAIPISIIN